jgi:TPR repeat protein
MLGVFHEKGFGFQRDLIEAYKWIKLAAAQANEQAAARLAAVSAAMTTEQIREGERRACEFKPVE